MVGLSAPFPVFASSLGLGDTWRPRPRPTRGGPPGSPLAFVLLLELLLQQVCLPVAQHEGEEGEDEGVEDADDGQDVRPAHRTVPQGVLPGLGPAHVPDRLGVPAVGKDHAAQHEAQS